MTFGGLGVHGVDGGAADGREALNIGNCTDHATMQSDVRSQNLRIGYIACCPRERTKILGCRV